MAENDASLRKRVKTDLWECGYDVDEAYTQETALDHAQKSGFDPAFLGSFEAGSWGTLDLAKQIWHATKSLSSITVTRL